jgi:hypothetical protein
MTPGWHLLTVFAAEYVSHPTRTFMYWETSKDEKWFYVVGEEQEVASDFIPPTREDSEETVRVQATPLSNSQWDPQFDWQFENIWPRSKATEDPLLNQEITEENQNIRAEAYYNITTGSLLLNSTNITGHPEPEYYDPNHMGKGIVFWWINDGPLSTDLETSYSLKEGNNVIYFAAIGFRVYFRLFGETILTPRADIDSTVFLIVVNITEDTSFFGFGSFVLIMSLLSIIGLKNKQRK